ncbi:MAG: glycosyltransferase, partial [Candidatus Omnitrophica bacterium]|nr:glycosyltransferase [Candidatus Omnitrophota bacterium]
VPEAFGRVIIEAQAVGVPVIATRVGGVVDVVQDGSNGLLVPPGDDRAIAEAILKLIKDKPLRDSLVQAGRESVEEKFNLNKMAAKILEVYKEVNSSLNILVIKLSALGDVILSIPSIRALREHFPQARISLLTDENGSHIVKGCPYLDEVVIYHKHSGPNKWREIFRLARILSKGWFDISVDLQNNKISHLTAWLAGVRQRYGYKKGITSKLLTTALDGAKMKIPPVEHQFRILSTIGLDIKKHKTKLELWPSVDDEKYIDNFLKEQWVNPSGVLVGINPGSSPRWPSKRWPYKNYAQVCQVLAARNIRTVITGTQKELKVARHIAADSKAKPIIAVGKTSVLQLAEL